MTQTNLFEFAEAFVLMHTGETISVDSQDFMSKLMDAVLAVRLKGHILTARQRYNLIAAAQELGDKHDRPVQAYGIERKLLDARIQPDFVALCMREAAYYITVSNASQDTRARLVFSFLEPFYSRMEADMLSYERLDAHPMYFAMHRIAGGLSSAVRSGYVITERNKRRLATGLASFLADPGALNALPSAQLHDAFLAASEIVRTISL